MKFSIRQRVKLYDNVLWLTTSCILLLMSCSPRNINMLQSNKQLIRSSAVEFPQLTIQKGDLLFIGVTSSDPQSDIRYNLNNYYTAGIQTVPSSTTLVGYLVDKLGTIKIPDVGIVKAEGYTTTDLSGFLREKLQAFLKDPIVTVRFLNFRITVLGEVARPGTFQVPSEKISIIDALGLAGDLTVYGRREDVMIIREKDGRREYATIDLTKGDLFSSPYFYLQQNDAIYVSMNKRKVVNSDQTLVRNISLATGIISTIAIIISALK